MAKWPFQSPIPASAQIAVAALAAVLLSACASATNDAKLLNPDPPGKMYAEADAMMAKSHYDDAAKKFEALDRHPDAHRLSHIQAGQSYAPKLRTCSKNAPKSMIPKRFQTCPRALWITLWETCGLERQSLDSWALAPVLNRE